MPFYDFECNNKHITEEITSYSDMQKGIKCPECGEKAERVISINSVRPSFGYEMTRFNMREQKRKSMTESQRNQSYTG